MISSLGYYLSSILAVYLIACATIFIWNFSDMKTIKDLNFEIKDSQFLFYCFEVNSKKEMCSRVLKFKLISNYTYNEKHEVGQFKVLKSSTVFQ